MANKPTKHRPKIVKHQPKPAAIRRSLTAPAPTLPVAVPIAQPCRMEA